jgi:aerobic C4-dicarboxylate transport protein
MRFFCWFSIARTSAVMVTSKGAAAVSGGSFVVLAATVTAFGVRPLEGLALLFGLYRFYVHGRCHCHCHLGDGG